MNKKNIKAHVRGRDTLKEVLGDLPAILLWNNLEIETKQNKTLINVTRLDTRTASDERERYHNCAATTERALDSSAQKSERRRGR